MVAAADDTNSWLLSYGFVAVCFALFSFMCRPVSLNVLPGYLFSLPYGPASFHFSSFFSSFFFFLFFVFLIIFFLARSLVC